MNLQEHDLEQIAKSQNLVLVETKDIIDSIYHGILLSMYRWDTTNPEEKELNEKIEKAFKRVTGSDWMEDRDKVLSLFAMGPPGQGKTTAFKVAAKKVAKDLGLNYKENPNLEKESITKKDFMFVSIECSGENNSLLFAGLPKLEKEDDESYMVRITQRSLACAVSAGGGLILLDDFANASPNVQNVGLSMTDEKRFQSTDLKGCYIGLTGNLGAIDGTNVVKIGSALASRVETYLVRDTVENFCERRMAVPLDEEVHDLGTIAFLQSQPECFFELPPSKELGGFSSPRTLDHLYARVSELINNFGEKKAQRKIENEAQKVLGPRVGKKFAEYYKEVYHPAHLEASRLVNSATTKGIGAASKEGMAGEEQNRVKSLDTTAFVTALTERLLQKHTETSTNFGVDVKETQEMVQKFVRVLGLLDKSAVVRACSTLSSWMMQQETNPSSSDTGWIKQEEGKDRQMVNTYRTKKDSSQENNFALFVAAQANEAKLPKEHIAEIMRWFTSDYAAPKKKAMTL